MAAKVCIDCSKKGFVGCEHWAHWPENLSRPHNWTDKYDSSMKIHCKECGIETTIPQLAAGAIDGFNCPRYKIQRPDSESKVAIRARKLKVVNAFSSGEHQLLWLAGGYAVYRKPGSEEIFTTLDEALKRCPDEMTQDLKLLGEWKGGYELPADEEHSWPEAFVQAEDASGES